MSLFQHTTWELKYSVKGRETAWEKGEKERERERERERRDRKGEKGREKERENERKGGR